MKCCTKVSCYDNPVGFLSLQPLSPVCPPLSLGFSHPLFPSCPWSPLPSPRRVHFLHTSVPPSGPTVAFLLLFLAHWLLAGSPSLLPPPCFLRQHPLHMGIISLGSRCPAVRETDQSWPEGGRKGGGEMRPKWKKPPARNSKKWGGCAQVPLSLGVCKTASHGSLCEDPDSPNPHILPKQTSSTPSQV